MEKICSCFGHSEIEITEELKKKLKDCYENLIKNNFQIFYFGGLSMFDYLCYQTVSELKIEYPHIQRVFCVTDRRHLNPRKRPQWLKEEEFEDLVYLELEFDFYYQRLYFRNIEMIKQSEFVIFYVQNTEQSGAYKAMQYAQKIKKEYINLGNL